MNDFLKKYRIEIIIFLFALIVRLMLFFINFYFNDHNLVHTIKADDGYYELSQNIINGHGFSFDSSSPYKLNSLRPPLWPYFIALLAYFGGYWLVFIIEILIASFIPVIGYKIAKYIIEEKMALAVAGLMIVEPYSVLLSFLLYTETSFTFFFLISLYFLVKYLRKERISYIVLSGIFLGLSMLIKPTVQYLPLLVLIYFVIISFRKNWKTKIVHGLLYAIATLAIVSPWLYRNYHYFNRVSMTVQPVFNLYVYLVPTVLSIDNKTNFATEIDNYVYKKGVNVLDISFVNEEFYKSQALPVIKDHKLALLKSIFITIVTFFTHDGMLTVLQYSGIKIVNIVNVPFLQLLLRPDLLIKAIFHYLFSPAIFIILGRIVWYMITALFLFGIYKYIRNNSQKVEAVLLGLIVAYFAFTTTINGLGVNARFRVPVLVLIFSFAVYGFYAILPFTKRIFQKKHEKNLNSGTCL